MAGPYVPSTGDPLLDEARQRWRYCQEWESTWRPRFVDDLKFANADSVNMWQWPDNVRRKRDTSNKPCLTLNMVRQHNLQIKNEMWQNKLSPKVRAMGNGATQESANVVLQIFRHIETQSRAQEFVYPIARSFQVDGGLGWWRILTDYVGPDTFDQDIFLQEVWDPFSIYMDPDALPLDPLKARFAFVFDAAVPRDLFEQAYPQHVEMAGKSALGESSVGDDWVEAEHVMVCEYFRKVSKPDTLISFFWQGERVEVRESMLPPSVAREVKADKLTRTRPTATEEIEWYLIAGEKVIDETVWPGRFIPLIPCLGEQTIVEGQMDRKGHTRYMRSAQHMYNYNASNQVEYGGTQGKTPWVGPAKAIEEFESYWNNANNEDYSYLPYNDVDPENPERPVEAPQRVAPPNFAPLYKDGMDTAFNQMMMTSGQWQNQMGMMGNERTGEAIARRQDQSDNATAHFSENFKAALIVTAVQFIDLLPRIYDTKRVLMLQGEDGEDFTLQIDPYAQQAYAQQMNHLGEVVARVFNPALGRYEIAPDVGPSLSSRRRETADAMTLILTQNPGLTGIIGDLLLGSLEFDKAQEAAMRLRRMVPPQALGSGPSQNEQQLQQLVQLLQQNLAKSLDAHGKDRVRLVAKDQMRDIDAYKAETDRMKALADMLPKDPQGVQALIEQLVKESLGTQLLPIIEANVHGIREEGSGEAAREGVNAGEEPPPVEGAQKAPDGNWYLSDPTRRGRYLRIAPLAQERAPPGSSSGA